MESGDVFVDSTPHFVAFCLYVFVFVVVLIGINSSCLYLMIIFTFFFLQRVARVGRHLSHVLHPLYPARRPLSDPTSRSRRMHVRQLMPRITASMAPRVSQSKSESPFSTIASKLHSLYISFFSPPSQPLTAKKKNNRKNVCTPHSSVHSIRSRARHSFRPSAVLHTRSLSGSDLGILPFLLPIVKKIYINNLEL